MSLYPPPYKLYVYHARDDSRLKRDRAEAERLLEWKSIVDKTKIHPEIFKYRELRFDFKTREGRARAIALLDAAQQFTDKKFFIHPFTHTEGILE